jgi:hypothetical protein
MLQKVQGVEGYLREPKFFCGPQGLYTPSEFPLGVLELRTGSSFWADNSED